MMANFECQLIGVQSHPGNITLGMSVREFPKRVSCTLKCGLPTPWAGVWQHNGVPALIVPRFPTADMSPAASRFSYHDFLTNDEL